MENYSTELNLESIISFGKHKGKIIKDVIKTDSGYMNWMRDKLPFKYNHYLKVRQLNNDLQLNIPNNNLSKVIWNTNRQDV